MLLRLLLAVTVASGSLQTDKAISGFATHYAKGVFERVEHNRKLPHAKCNIASDFHTIGVYVWVYSRNTRHSLKCRVSDVSAPKDRARHIKARLFELDYYSARYICGKQFSNGWRNCPVVVSPVKPVNRRLQ